MTGKQAILVIAMKLKNGRADSTDTTCGNTNILNELSNNHKSLQLLHIYDATENDKNKANINRLTFNDDRVFQLSKWLIEINLCYKIIIVNMNYGKFVYYIKHLIIVNSIFLR